MAEQAARIGLKVIREDSLSYDATKDVFFFTALSNRDVASDYPGTGVIFDGTSEQFTVLLSQTGKAAGNTITAWLVAIHVAGLGGVAMLSRAGEISMLLQLHTCSQFHQSRRAINSIRH